MTCKIYDYTKILKDQIFLNSPFFDGMKDIFAVKEIMKYAGFRSKGRFDPGNLIKQFTDHADTLGTTRFPVPDNRVVRILPYTLPSEYKRLEQPAFRFKEGSSLYEGIHTIAKRAAKVFYFDQFGIAHLEDFLDTVINSLTENVDLVALFKFTSNPDLSEGQLIFNKMEHSFDVSSVYNTLKLISTTPDAALLFLDELDWGTVRNPDNDGFIGYPKQFLQIEGMFGSQLAMRRIMRLYKVMFRPPIIYNFETYGVPLRALDIISVNDDAARVVKVDHEINPEQNRWWMRVETERFQPVTESPQGVNV